MYVDKYIRVSIMCMYLSEYVGRHACVKVQNVFWYMILCYFLDNSDSPSIVEQQSQKAGVVYSLLYCSSCLDLVLCLMPGL